MKEIPLTQGKVAIVDDDDFEWLSQWAWYFNDGYALRSGATDPVTRKRPAIRMHREIMRTPDGMVTDHINGDKLDNRRANLRICTNEENVRNRRNGKNSTSGYKGVTWNKKEGKWYAQIMFKSKAKHLGAFPLAELAHEFYCLAADMLHGEYANHG